MDDIIISVIVPIYNGEKYIHRVVDSILPQLNNAVELILVDDGSTDASSSLCDTYAEKYNTIRVVHKANGGLSSARNAGIVAARGVYLSFVDVDDYISPNAYSHLLEVIQAYHPDCIDFGWNYVNSHGEQTSNLHRLEKNRLLKQDVIQQVILPPLLNLCKDDAHFIYDFSWNKLFRSDIVRQYQVYFDEGRRIWEDRPFVVHYLKYCNTYYAVDQCYYNYVNTPDSLSRHYSLQFFDIILENYRLYKEWYGDSYDFGTQYVQDYWAHTIENIIFRSLEQAENTEQIRCNILHTLSDPQVIEWFTNRNPQNRFEQEVSKLIINGKTESALRYYASRAKQFRTQNVCSTLFQKLKTTIRRFLVFFEEVDD